MRPVLSRRTAFTLIELIIIIVVLGLLAGIGILTYTSVVTTSQDKAAAASLTDVAREASALAAQNGESEWSEDDWTTALADTAAGPALAGSGVSAAGKLTLVNTAADSTNSSSMSYGQVSLQTRAGGVAGLAMKTQAGHCVFVRDVLPQQITTWTAASDLGGNCLASVGLTTGQAGTYTHSDTVVAGATPLAPTGLTATLSGSTVTLSWASVQGATGGYTVYRSTDGGATWAPLAGPQAATSYTDGAAPAGLTSTYTVTATATNESPKSAPAQVTLVPAAPAGVSASPAGTTITVSWQPVTGAASYAVTRDGTVVPAAAAMTGTSFADSGFPQNGATHTYTVTATNAAGTGPASAPVSAPVMPPSVGSASVALSGTTATVSWAAAPGATTYQVNRSYTRLSTGAVTYGVVGSATGTSLADPVPVPNGYSVGYSVAAGNDAGYATAIYAGSVQTTKLTDTAPAAGANIMANGGFESGQWTLRNVNGVSVGLARYTASSGYPPAEGTWDGAMNTPVSDGTTSIQNDTAQATAVGQTWCISGMVEGNEASGHLTLWNMNGSSGLAAADANYSHLAGPTNWVRISTCLKITAAGTALRAELYPNSGPTVFIDDVRIWRAS